MRINVEDEGPVSAEDHEVFRALHLTGSGKVRASVNERMLSLETRRGHALDLRLSNITRVHHHHTRLVSFTYALFGCALIYAAERILIPDTLQILTAIVGLAMIIGWFGTRKPTLTLDTEVGDCHTITGNDASLMRLSTLLKRLESGMGLEEARIGLDILNRDLEYPRTAMLHLQEVPVEPMHLSSSTSISSFLTDELPGNDLPNSVLSHNTMDLNIELDFDEMEQTIANQMQNNHRTEKSDRSITEHGLFKRGIANAQGRRGSIETSPHQPIPQPQPYPQQLENHQHAPYQSYSNPTPVSSSYHHIAQASHADMPPENQAPQPTETPSMYLPSFVGKEGAHIPGHTSATTMEAHSDLEAFRSSDAILSNHEIEEQTSLIQKARRHTPEIPNIPTQKITRGQKVNSRLRPKAGLRSESRLRPKARSQSGQTSKIREMVAPAAAHLIENATLLANRVLNGRSTSQQNSGSTSTRELRHRSAQNHQTEAIESIKNLSIARGGNLPDSEIQHMLAHLERRQPFLEQEVQETQEYVPVLDDISFDELKDSKTHHAEHAGEAGLPRIDL